MHAEDVRSAYVRLDERGLTRQNSQIGRSSGTGAAAATKLWHKGATSGQIQKVTEIRTDRSDVVLLKVTKPGRLPRRLWSCFYRSVQMNDDGTARLMFEETERLQNDQRLLPTTVVGSYVQQEWLVDRDNLKVGSRRGSAHWRCGALIRHSSENAQDDATLLAIRDMERAGIDIVDRW